jgi:hypothetical protein
MPAPRIAGAARELSGNKRVGAVSARRQQGMILLAAGNVLIQPETNQDKASKFIKFPKCAERSRLGKAKKQENTFQRYN